MKEYKIGLCAPTLNNFKGLADLIWSAKSDHIIQTYLYPNWRLNHGLSKSWNSLIQQAIEANCDFILVSNDDCILAPKYTINNMVKFFEQIDDSCVLISARAHNEHLGWKPDGILELTPITDDYGECPDFACFMIKPDFFNKCGTFDENFRFLMEDNDMHRRINLLGYHAYNIGNAPYYHHVSQTVKTVDTDGSVYRNSRDYYIRKWGSMPTDNVFQTPYNDPNLSPKEWINAAL